MAGYVDWLREHSSDNSPYDAALSLLSYIADSLDEAVIGLDGEGTVILWNTASEEAFGFSQDQVRGLCITELIPLDFRDEITDLIERIRDTRRGYEWVGGVLAHGAGSVGASLAFYPIAGSEGDVIGFTVVASRLGSKQSPARDVSEGLQVTNDQLERAIEEILADAPMDDRDASERATAFDHDEPYPTPIEPPEFQRSLWTAPLHRYPWTGSARFSAS